MSENIVDSFSERPWGNYRKFYQEQGVWVKRVEVKPGARLSLQKHQKRSEKWVVVAGQGVAIIGQKEERVGPGSVIDVPLGSAHRIGNDGQEPLVFIEVATGSYLGEDDIVRIQDDYKRD